MEEWYHSTLFVDGMVVIVFVANTGSFSNLGGTNPAALQTGDNLSQNSYGTICEAGTLRAFAAKLNGLINRTYGYKRHTESQNLQ